jgi:mRNA-degrading endonuclease RelE of RelBE toxin-antitoxin system
MKIEFESSFERDLKKLSAEILIEIDEILDALEDSSSLSEVPYSIKKLSGFPKLYLD